MEFGIYKLLSAGQGGFRGRRFWAWLNPFEYIKGEGWQVSQSLMAIGSGGILGVGIGDSKQKQSYIPEPHNDFIFAVFAEEVGFIGVIVVMLLFIAFIIRGMIIARNAPDLFGKILATGIVTMFALHVMINLAVVSNLIPVTGMSLPFFSYGGTAIISLIVQVGILLNISKISNKVLLEQKNKMN